MNSAHDKISYAITSALGPSLAGPMSDRVVNPDAPRPRPATYDAGAVWVKNASLLCFVEAIERFGQFGPGGGRKLNVGYWSR